MGNILRITGPEVPTLPLGSGHIVTSLDPSTPEGRRKIYRARTVADMASKLLDGEVFRCQDVLIQAVELQDRDTGEYKPVLKVAYLDPEGVIVSSYSEGAPRSIAEIVLIEGPPPWMPPLLLRIVKMSGGRYGSWNYLDWVGRDPLPVEGADNG